MKKILMIRAGLVHPPLFAANLLKRVFRREGYDILAIRNFEELLKITDLDSFSACVIYVHHQDISDAALETFGRFVHNGGGVLGIHSATACFKDRPHYFEILGGRFSGHGLISAFEIEPVSGPNEPFDGFTPFTVTDELYLHEFQQGICPHFTALHAGLPQPVVWTHFYGAGKVCCAVPGHLLQTIQNEIYLEVLLRGLAWVSA